MLLNPTFLSFFPLRAHQSPFWRNMSWQVLSWITRGSVAETACCNHLPPCQGNAPALAPTSRLLPSSATIFFSLNQELTLWRHTQSGDQSDRMQQLRTRKQTNRRKSVEGRISNFPCLCCPEADLEVWVVFCKKLVVSIVWGWRGGVGACLLYLLHLLFLDSLFALFSFLFLTPVEIRQVLKCGRGCFNRLIDSTIQQVNCSMEISSFGWSLRNVASCLASSDCIQVDF